MSKSTMVKISFSLFLLVFSAFLPLLSNPGEHLIAADMVDYTVIENKVKALVDAERAKFGLPPLEMNETLRFIARKHSQDMVSRGYFSHVSPEGLQPADRVTAAGLVYGALAENIASNRGLPDPGAFAVQSWMTSPGHRDNILDAKGCGCTQTGVGIAKRADGTYFFTQVFFKPRQRVSSTFLSAISSLHCRRNSRHSG